MKLRDLLKGIERKRSFGNEDIEIEGVSYDSRKTGEGDVFVAIPGTIADGHKYASDAIDKGASAVICEKDIFSDKYKRKATIVVVENSRKALGVVSNNFNGDPSAKMKIIGVTGTNGKTTVTFLIRRILKESGVKTGVVGTTGIYFGNEKKTATHTTPESLELTGILKDMLEKGAEAAVLETSSHALHQGRVSEIKFDAGVFTNLSSEHLDYHSSMEEYAEAKRILFKNLPEKGIAAANGDDSNADTILKETKAKTAKVGRKSDLNDYLIENEELRSGGSRFILTNESLDEINIELPLPGRFNVDNAALAAATALEMGVAPETVAEALKKAEGAPGRMSSIKLSNGAVGIVDYAHTPDALEKALTACKESLSEGAKLICVFGCGGDRDKTKRAVMGEIAANIADAIVITDDNPRTEDSLKIIEQIYRGVPKEKRGKVTVVSSRRDAIIYAAEKARKNDIVLVAGKGHETYQIIGETKYDFDDLAVLSEL